MDVMDMDVLYMMSIGGGQIPTAGEPHGNLLENPSGRGVIFKLARVHKV